MRVARGTGSQKIVAEEHADAAAYERDHERIDNAKRAPVAYAPLAARARHAPGARSWSRPSSGSTAASARTGYDREYEQEPPTETEPALVPTLLRQGGEAGSYEFTATLFDLIRRGRYTAEPATTER